jgi:methionyl-tRNA formyltransferase
MPSRAIKLVFMGSPDFAVPSLDALHESARFAPALVVSQPDRARGRGRRIVPTPVRARALDLGIPTEVMTRKTYPEVVDRIADLAPDVVVVVAFGIILKSDLLHLPRLGCVNVHASLLPRHRGVSPIQAAILAGDDVTGCTTMRIDEGIDTGDVLLESRTRVEPGETAGSLSGRLAGMGADLLVRTIDGLVDGTVVPRPQSEDGATYTHKIQKADGEIDWSLPAIDVDRHIRAMTPWPSAFTSLADRRLIVVDAVPREIDTGGARPGTVLSTRPLVVACAPGAMELRTVKPQGRGAMGADAFLAGHDLSPGARFG